MQPAEGPTPLYMRVQSALRQDIRHGRLAPGTALPSEKELELTHGVSRITVRRALDELEREGLVIRTRGRPARVAEPLVSVARTQIDEDLAAMLDLVRGTDPEVLCFKWRLADEAMRATLEVADDEPVLQVDRLRRSGGQPMLHTTAHVPAFIGAKLEKERLGKRSMLDLLVKSGVKIAQAAQIMSAAPCPASLAPLLDLKQGDPIFRIERLVRDDLNRPIQHLIVTFRWDSFSYRVSSTSSPNGRVVEIASAGRMEFPTLKNEPPAG